MLRFKTAHDLHHATHDYVQALLLALADTKLFLGFHYGEWTFGTPALEACIAACSMSQDEFGHLRLFHACLNTQFNEKTQDLIEKRPLHQFANVPSLDHPLQDWAEFVAVNLLTDGAVTVVMNALKNSSFEPVANFIDKMVEEEKHHLRNAQGWFRTLATHDSQSKAAIEEACRRVLVSTLEWLGPEDDEMMSDLKQEQIINIPWKELTQQFMDWVGPLAESQGIDVGLAKDGNHWRPSFPQDFSRWIPTTRRCAPTQPDEKLLYHLTGSKNAIFKVGEA